MGQAQQAPGPGVRGRGKQRENPTPKAGRNLPAAIVVGLGMLFAVLGGLLFLPLGFVLIVTAFAIFGVWEIFRALEAAGTRLPIIPVMAGTVAMPARRLLRRPRKPALRHAGQQRGGAAVAVPGRRRRFGAQHLRRCLHPGLGAVPDQLRRAAAAHRRQA